MIDKIRFTKMHGTGNDYIYVNTLHYPLHNPGALAIGWSKYHTGIGSDGLVLIGASKKADFSMRIFNADGSEAMMCGNATRCIGKYVYDNGLTKKTEISLETPAGIKHIRLHTETGKVSAVTVDMGTPEILKTEVAIDGIPVTGTAVSMGNPHLVLYVEDLNQIDLSGKGPELEYHPFFTDRTNVEFVQILSKYQIRMKVWERGSGVTMACGTGACASVVAGAVTGRTGRDLQVLMDGGTLNILWDENDGRVYMTGEAVTVFEGEIEL